MIPGAIFIKAEKPVAVAEIKLAVNPPVDVITSPLAKVRRAPLAPVSLMNSVLKFGVLASEPSLTLMTFPDTPDVEPVTVLLR